MRKVHCLSSLSQRTFGFERAGCSLRVFFGFEKKTKRCLTPESEDGLMSDLSAALCGVKKSEFQKFFDNHLICAIDTVSVINS